MIQAMKKVNIVVLKEDYEKVIKSLQKYSILMIINKNNGSINPSLELNENLQQRVEKVIKFANKYKGKKPLFGDYKVVEYDKFAEVNKEIIDKIAKIEDLQSKVNNYLQINKEIKNEVDNLLIWKDLDIKPCDIKKTNYVKMLVGYIPNKNRELFEKFVTEGKYIYQILDVNKNGLGVFISYFYEDDDIVTNELKMLNFTDVNLPKTEKKINDYVADLLKEIADNEELINQINQELEVFAKDIDEYELLSDQILSQEQINNISYETTVETSIIEGWIRSDTLDTLKIAIEEVTEVYDIEYLDPLADEVVPTYTKNKKFASQFETITDMFSKPNSKEIDPNPVMSVWYWLLFGMMMGDFGYGLLMLFICLLLRKLMRPKGNTLKLINVIMYSSIPTMFWGIMFGSYFGFNPAVDFGWKWAWYWFSPMDDPIKMLIVSIAIGAMHLITGLVIKCYINIKEKNIFEMLAKDLSWILIMIGIGAYFINQTVGLVMAVIGVVLIIVFSGAKKKSVFGKAAFGLLGLYDVTAYLGDLLSYSRIMALAMSSAAVAMVMNVLAQMVGGSFIGMIFSGIIFVVGHLFNLVLGLLSAYVHDSRLQYIEFFGKFYEGGGVDFKPLSVQSKYINDINYKKENN